MNNTISTVNILKASVESNVRRFIYSSSSSVYGNPTNLPLKEDFKTNPLSPYGAQKLYGEILCKTDTTPIIRYLEDLYSEKSVIPKLAKEFLTRVICYIY